MRAHDLHAAGRDELVDELFAAAPVGLALLDRDLRYVRVNQRLADIHGVPVAEHRGRTVEEVVPGLASAARQAFEAALESAEALMDLRLEGSTAAQPDVVRCFSASVHPLLGGGDHAIGLGVVVFDTTDQVAAERDRNEALALLEALYDAAPIGLAFADAELRFRRINDAMVRMNATPLDAHLGRVMTEVSEDFKRVEPYFRQVLETGRPMLDLEIPFAAVQRSFAASYYPVTLGDRTLGVGAIVRETTDLRRTQAALEAERRLLRDVIDRAPVAIALLEGPDLRYRLLNEHVKAVSPLRVEDPLGMPAREALVPEAAEGLDRVASVLESGEPLLDPDLRIAVDTADPRGWRGHRYYRYSVDPVRDPDGTIGSVLVVGTEKTEDVRRRERIEGLAAAAHALLRSGLSVDGVLQVVAERTPGIVEARSCAIRLASGEERSSGDAAGSPERIAAPLAGRDGRDLGVLEVTGRTLGTFGAEDEQLLLQLGLLVSQAIENARLHEWLALERDRSALLAESAGVLDAQLDVRATSDALVRFLVPRFADRAEVVTREAGPELRAAVRRLGATEAVERGAVRASGPRTVVAPLAARGEGPLGVLVLERDEDREPYTDGDVALAGQLARRAGLALDNARLLEERAAVARDLQAALLPPELPAVPGVRLLARYHAAARGIEVGGDFYDVHPAADGAWAITIGDVCGRGAAAAAVTAMMRYTLRAAADEPSPAVALERLNAAMLAQQPAGRFATVLTGRLTPRPGGGARLRWASGGHPWPVLVRRDGRSEALAGQGSLLGVTEHIGLTEREADLAPGDVLVLYTDGVLEADRTRLLDPDSLARVLAATGPDPEALTRRLHELAAGGRGADLDDAATLVLAFTEAGA